MKRGGSSVRFGFIPAPLFDALNAIEWQTRVSALEELKVLVEGLHDVGAVTPHLSALVRFLGTTLGDRDFKIGITTLQIIQACLSVFGYAFRPHIGKLIPPLLEKLGDERRGLVLHATAMKVFRRMMQVLTPEPVLAELVCHLDQNRPLVSEEVVNIIIAGLLSFPKTDFDFNLLVENVTPLMARPGAVYFACLEALALMHSMAGSTMYDLLLKHGIPELVPVLKERCKKEDFARLDADGLVIFSAHRSSSTQRNRPRYGGSPSATRSPLASKDFSWNSSSEDFLAANENPPKAFLRTPHRRAQSAVDSVVTRLPWEDPDNTQTVDQINDALFSKSFRDQSGRPPRIGQKRKLDGSVYGRASSTNDLFASLDSSLRHPRDPKRTSEWLYDSADVPEKRVGRKAVHRSSIDPAFFSNLGQSTTESPLALSYSGLDPGKELYVPSSTVKSGRRVYARTSNSSNPEDKVAERPSSIPVPIAVEESKKRVGSSGSVPPASPGATLKGPSPRRGRYATQGLEKEEERHADSPGRQLSQSTLSRLGSPKVADKGQRSVTPLSPPALPSDSLKDVPDMATPTAAKPPPRLGRRAARPSDASSKGKRIDSDMSGSVAAEGGTSGEGNRSEGKATDAPSTNPRQRGKASSALPPLQTSAKKVTATGVVPGSPSVNLQSSISPNSTYIPSLSSPKQSALEKSPTYTPSVAATKASTTSSTVSQKSRTQVSSHVPAGGPPISPPSLTPSLKSSLSTPASKDGTAPGGVEEEIQPIRNPESTIVALFRDFEGKSWNEQVDAFGVIRSISKRNPGVIKAHMREVVSMIVAGGNNLRSQVSRAAVTACPLIFSGAGRTVEPFLESLVELLLKKASQTDKFLQDDAHAALRAMVVSCSPSKTILVLAPHVKSKSAMTRAAASRSLAGVARALGGKASTAKEFERLVKLLVELAQDGSSDARNHARRAIHQLSTACGQDVFEASLQGFVSETDLRVIREAVEKGEKIPGGSAVQTSPMPRPKATGKNVAKSPAPRRGLPPEFDHLDEFVGKAQAPDWRLRQEGVQCLTSLVVSYPTEVCLQNTLMKVFDVLCPRCSDGNLNVRLLALRSLEEVIPLLGDGLAPVLPALVPELAQALAASSASVRDTASSLLSLLATSLDPLLLVSPFTKQIGFGNPIVKVAMVDFVCTLIDEVYERKPQELSKKVVPAAASLIAEGGVAQAAGSRLAQALYAVMGDALFEGAKLDVRSRENLRMACSSS